MDESDRRKAPLWSKDWYESQLKPFTPFFKLDQEYNPDIPERCEIPCPISDMDGEKMAGNAAKRIYRYGLYLEPLLRKVFTMIGHFEQRHESDKVDEKMVRDWFKACYTSMAGVKYLMYQDFKYYQAYNRVGFALPGDWVPS